MIHRTIRTAADGHSLARATVHAPECYIPLSIFQLSPMITPNGSLLFCFLLLPRQYFSFLHAPWQPATLQTIVCSHSATFCRTLCDMKYATLDHTHTHISCMQYVAAGCVPCLYHSPNITRMIHQEQCCMCGGRDRCIQGFGGET